MPRPFAVPPHKSIYLVTERAEVSLMVKAARTKQKRRIENVAAACGLSISTLSNLERNVDRSFIFDKLLDVLDHLGLALLITDKAQAEEILRQIEG